MSNSELNGLKSLKSITTDAGARSSLASLDTARPGELRRVARIDPAQAHDLAQHGLIEGATIRVESKAPLGGPVVISLGRARLAIGRDVARGIRVEDVA